MTLCIVGVGAMGRWLAETLADAPSAFDLAFADTDAAVAADAAAAFDDAEAVPIDDGGPEGDRSFETVCLAVPIPAVEDAVANWAPHAGSAMLDLSGVMAGPVDAMGEHLPDRERASLHPLFAPERAPGNVAVVEDAVGPTLEPLLDALRDAGNDLFETTPEEHDDAMTTVQAKSHAAVLAWALAGEEVREEFHTPVSAGLADIAATVTGGDARVYADIQDAFGGADAVADAARTVADADGEAFADLYAEAGATADGLEPEGER
ncbi:MULTISPECIES: prephenate dehydrogenase/arogenate dehydrogenase family protein [Halolamina]|uniref:Prephenate dehydrogenase n=1 Tax=Halolamina pelagica TaxID=699431 RepID=A0A1I5QQ95_9EURY|nr:MULTISPECIES: prephenate dehydrogenase/arogenate dehydrogenase family protein [Halolamina]NHX35491.1 prephenate dehydrogenase [Halolamina sp. R1-12]SFP48444.1 prephenate dehydrogenase [Halolamina pelagica]